MDRRIGSFIWNIEKEAANLQKHGVDFETAARAFKDPKRKIYTDERHGKGEARYFCIGEVEGRILTVRFLHRHETIRIFGAGYWRKGRRYYEQKDG